MGVSPKWVKSKRRREKERLNDGNNNGQATHGARKHAWRTQARMAHASRLGQNVSKLTLVKGRFGDLQTSDSELVTLLI